MAGRNERHLLAQEDTQADTQLFGRRLALARGMWGAAAFLLLGFFVASFPTYLAEVQTVCAGVTCFYAPSPPDMAQSLHALGLSENFYLASTAVCTVCFALVCCLVAVVIFWRKSTDWLALLVAFLLLLLSTHNVSDTLSSGHSVWQWPAEGVSILTFGVFMLVFSLFPNGRFVPRWAHWIPVGYLGFSLLRIFLDVTPPPPHPPPLLELLIGSALGLAWFALTGSFLAAQIVRYRKTAHPLQRQQIKWVFFAEVASVVEIIGLTAPAILFPALNQPGSLYPLISPLLTMLFLLLIPLGIGFAILRYRLWDIDLIINRTLVYGALTASIVGLYIFVVGYLGTLFRTGGNLLISLIATGLVAVLFQPLRGWLQRGVNHLFYGQRDEPYAVISRLSQRLEATLAPEAVLPTVVETVAQALKLPYVAMVLKEDDQFTTAASYGTPTGNALKLLLVYQNETLGELLLAPRAPGEAWTPADRRLLDDLARHAGAAAHAVRLTAELQRSQVHLLAARERLVLAREEERRRLRRDLHDGLGPTLAALHLQAGTIRTLIVRDPAAADAQVMELRAELRTLIATIRRLVYALRPPALDQLGLLAALGQAAAQCSRPAEGAVDLDQASVGLRVRLEAPDVLPTLPAAVEVAAYWIVQEALTNVVRHAQAHSCVVRLHLSEELELEISDDGLGLPAECRAGVGLRSIRERAEELGGTCRIEPGQTSGTRVLVQLPMPKEERDGTPAHPDRR